MGAYDYMKVHPAAEWFPMLPPESLRELADDIKKNGLKNPIVLLWNEEAQDCNVILDGRNRLKACEMADVTPEFVSLDEIGGGDPVAYVISSNLHRRHLDESQRAMVAARAKGMFEEEAKKRQKASQFKVGGASPTVSANLRSPRDEEKASEKAASLTNVSPRSVEHASKVLSGGTPELVAAVDSGKLAVSVASVIADAPEEKQRAIVATGDKREARKAADEIREQKRVDSGKPAKPVPPTKRQPDPSPVNGILDAIAGLDKAQRRSLLAKIYKLYPKASTKP
jgi:ParB-like chromosome segregation protein Spo0J